MRCPHCNTAINIEWDESNAYGKDLKPGAKATAASHGECPECESLIVKLVRGVALKADYYYTIGDDEPQSEEIIYPLSASRYVEPEVPEVYRIDFMEASGGAPN